MEPYEEIYNAFLTALRHFVEKDGYGSQSVFAANAGLSNAALSRILKLGDKKQASLKSQVSLAKACGYNYEDFIALGRKLLSGDENPEKAETPALILEAEPPVSDSDTGYIEELKQLIKDLRAERDGLNADKAELKAEKAELKKEIAELKERIRSLEAQQAITAELDVKKIAG